MSFLRHAEIYRSDVVYKTVESLGRAAASRWSAPGPAAGRSPRTAPCSSSAMSFRAGYSLAGCSPAEPASASPTALSIHCGLSAGNDLSANGNLSLVSVPQHRGAVQPVPVFHSSTRPLQLFPRHPPQGSFQRFLRALDVRAQRLVDQVLITSTARISDLLPKPVQNIVIQPDGALLSLGVPVPGNRHCQPGCHGRRSDRESQRSPRTPL